MWVLPQEHTGSNHHIWKMKSQISKNKIYLNGIPFGRIFCPKCIWFAWQKQSPGEAAGVASRRRCQKLSPRVAEPMSASSKADPLLAEPKPISDGGSTPVTRDLKWRKNCWARGDGQDELRVSEKQPCRPMERGVCAEAGLLAGDPLKDPCQSSLLLMYCTLWRRPSLQQFVKNRSL